jgi:hypothetical protein
MDEGFVQMSHAVELLTWGLVFTALLTFLGVAWSAYVALLVRREGRQVREILFEMREDSKRIQFYLFSKFGPADSK